MKPLSNPRSLALTILLGSLGLSGCGGTMNFPDAVSSQQVQGPVVHGSVYGGHAPIVGSHVYMLQPGTGGYGSKAISLLTSASGGTADTNDPKVPVGSYYVTTDSSGGFAINSYNCTAGQPVYLYSYGGTATGVTTGTQSTTTTYNISGALTISNPSTTTGTNGTATFTFTSSTPEDFKVGTMVTFINSAPVTGTLPVIAQGLTSTTFSVVASNYAGAFQGNYGNQRQYFGAGNYTNPGGSATVTTTSTVNATNPTSQLATLGICPSSAADGFNGVLKYVYMNEVSTVATAYTFQPFTSPSNNTAWDIGTSGTTQAQLGIANAALTAAQLYNIQGGTTTSSTNDGEGHIANYQTQSGGVANQGNGVVPQATIDALANILAACIDSTPAINGGLSTQCKTLFNTATDNGNTVASGDTAATDTATAAINIARYPAGNSSGTPSPTYVTDLYGIPTGTVPYAPTLNAAPHDWTLAINYPYTAVSGYAGATNNLLGSAESIEVDSIGQIWVTAQTNKDIARYSPLGILNTSESFNYIPGYVSIDGNGNAWTGNANSTSPIFEYNSNGVLTTTYNTQFNHAYVVLTDKAGDAFTFASTANTGGNYEMFEYPAGSTSSTTATQISISPSIFTAGTNAGHGAIDAAGDLWVTTENPGNQIARFTPAGVTAFTPITTTQQPEFPAIDASGNAWIAIQATNSVIDVVSPTGTVNQLTPATTGAELTATFGAAIDGNGNAWFVNRNQPYSNGTAGTGASTLIELNGATKKAISPATNYVPEAQYGANASNTALSPILDGSLNLAIDPSGNLWITNYTAGGIVEVVGAAAPVVTPLSVAAGTNKLGQKP